MRHLATAVEDLNTDFVPLSEELAYFAELDLEVALSDLEPEAHLLEFTLLVVAAAFLSLLLLLVLIFAPVDDFDNRWVGIR